MATEAGSVVRRLGWAEQRGMCMAMGLGLGSVLVWELWAVLLGALRKAAGAGVQAEHLGMR